MAASKKPLNTAGDAVKEMKSVAEEDSEEDEGGNNMGLNLKDIKDMESPKDEEHEQNE